MILIRLLERVFVLVLTVAGLPTFEIVRLDYVVRRDTCRNPRRLASVQAGQILEHELGIIAGTNLDGRSQGSRQSTYPLIGASVLRVLGFKFGCFWG